MHQEIYIHLYNKTWGNIKNVVRKHEEKTFACSRDAGEIEDSSTI